MEIIFEVILEFLAELFLQLFGEAIFELFGHSLKEPFRRPKPVNPWLAAFGYIIFGAAAGGLSLWVLPNLFISSEFLRHANLIITPIIAGLVMAWIGSWRRKHEKEVIGLETFTYGFCFAFSMAIVRYAFGN